MTQTIPITTHMPLWLQSGHLNYAATAAAIIRLSQCTDILFVPNVKYRRNVAKVDLLRPNIHKQPKQVRLGIYAGAFDPVHAGHVGFALQALQAASLDEIIFMPERRPPLKPGVEHYAHRVAMLKKALKPHPKLAVLEMVDRQYSVSRTLPQLRSLFPQAQLIFLMGSDAALDMPAWPHVQRLLEVAELVVGVRSQHQHQTVAKSVQAWTVQPRALTIIDSYAPDVSSAVIRQALRTGQYAQAAGHTGWTRAYGWSETRLRHGS